MSVPSGFPFTGTVNDADAVDDNVSQTTTTKKQNKEKRKVTVANGNYNGEEPNKYELVTGRIKEDKREKNK